MKKALVGAALVGVALRLIVLSGADAGLADAIRDLSGGGASISIELGSRPEAENLGLMVESVPVEAPEENEQAVNLGEAQGAAVQTAVMAGGVSIRNDTALDIDPEEILASASPPYLSAGQPQVLIIHTHGSEAYTQTPGDLYEESDPYRTQDCGHNVLALGEVLKTELEKWGLTVIHDTGIYDYPSYTGSYSRSGAAVEAWLEKYPGIGVVIDLHRDAIGSGEVVYKTWAEVGGEGCAQVMLLVGTGENGLSHPGWRQNLALALKMQEAMEESSPTLARPLAIKNERYNQHLTAGSLILEVGSTGNTLGEAVRAVELFGAAVGPLLAEMIV